MRKFTKEQQSWKSRLDALNVEQAGFARSLGIHVPTFNRYLNLRMGAGTIRHQEIEGAIQELENLT